MTSESHHKVQINNSPTLTMSIACTCTLGDNIQRHMYKEDGGNGTVSLGNTTDYPKVLQTPCISRALESMLLLDSTATFPEP